MSKETGALIKKARTAAGMTQKELAEKAGLSASMLGKAERGEKELTEQQLEAVAGAIGVAPEELMEKVVTDEELLELFKAADPEAKKAAVSMLKGEKPQGGDMMSMLSGMMGGAGGEGGDNPMAGMMGMLGGMMGGAGAEGGEGGDNPMAGMMGMLGGMMGGAGAEGGEGGDNPMAGMMGMLGGMMGGAGAEAGVEEKDDSKSAAKKTKKKSTKKTKK